MADSNEVNSQRKDDDANENIVITKGDLQALIALEVEKAIKDHADKPIESSASHSKHSSKHSSKHTTKHHSKPSSETKEHSEHSSNIRREREEYKRKAKFSKDGCSYKYFVSCKPRDFTGEKGAVETLRWLDEIETVVEISGCAEKVVVKYVAQSFKGDALIWWKSMIQSSGKVHLYNLSWEKFVELIKETNCPCHEVEKIETNFLGLQMKNLDCRKHLSDYNSLSRKDVY